MIVAELGNNHLASLERLDVLTAAALASPVDALSIQLREDDFYTQSNIKRFDNIVYQQWCETVKSSKKMVGLAVCEVNHLDLYDCDFYKILSKDYFNKDLVNAALRTGKPVYLSTGMCTLNDLSLWSDYKNAHFIHTDFSPHTKDVNLKAIQSMQMRVGNRVGFGRHCYDLNVLAAAIGMEPESVWFYIRDNDDRQPDFDHAVQIEMIEPVVIVLKDLYTAIGSGYK